MATVSEAHLSGRSTFNWNFLQNYQPYVIQKWRKSYFAYDKFKQFYKHEKKCKDHIDVQHYETDFHNEIKRIYHFMTGISRRIDDDLTLIEDAINAQSTKSLDEAQRDRNVVMSLRNLYEEIQNLEKFYHLNYYSIVKIGKKYDKLIKIAAKKEMKEQKGHDPSIELGHPESARSKMLRTISDKLKNMVNPQPKALEVNDEGVHIRSWKSFPSGRFFYDEFTSTLPAMHLLKARCINVYAAKFRTTYSEVAEYELKYIKIPDQDSGPAQFRLGLKFGVIFCMIIWLITYSSVITDSFEFWTQPGLFVYTMIGNLLLYRFAWAANIFVWSKMGINYISALQLSNSKPNLLLVTNQTASLLLLYFINLMVFCVANMGDSIWFGTYLSYGCPFILLLVSIVYQIYESMFLFGNKHISRGVFGMKVFKNMLIAPFAVVRFRDVFVADVLTSFNRVIADTLYASCWIFSGSFATPYDVDGDRATSTNFGTSFLNCSNHNMVYVVSFLQLLPLMTRTLQCFRGIYDASGNPYPQGYNAVKYLLSIFVVYVGLFHNNNLPFYYSTIVLATVYKWWWDVVMDWGLCEILPLSLQDALNWRNYSSQGKLFLRSRLMFPSVLVYYISIFVDLVLRFLWVMSLLPPDALGDLGGYKLSFFLGSMEILRRSMWGILRVEYEHLKLIKQHVPGILSNHMNEKLPMVSRKSLVQLFTAHTHGNEYVSMKDVDEIDERSPSIRMQKTPVESPDPSSKYSMASMTESTAKNPLWTGDASQPVKTRGKFALLESDSHDAADILDDSL
jgi:hypothetical protein